MTIGKDNAQAFSFFFLLHDNMTAEIEHGWNDNHHSNDRLNMTRDSEKKRRKRRKTKSLFLLVFQKNKCICNVMIGFYKIKNKHVICAIRYIVLKATNLLEWILKSDIIFSRRDIHHKNNASN